MKKIFLFAMIAAAAASFTSCKKNYTCACTITDNGTVVGTSSVTFNATKSQATSSCNSQATISGGYGATATISCEIQ